MSMRQKSSYFYQLDQQILEQVKTNPYLGLKMTWNGVATSVKSLVKPAVHLVSFEEIYGNAPKSANN